VHFYAKGLMSFVDFYPYTTACSLQFIACTEKSQHVN